VKMEEGAEETLAQHRDRLALALAHGPVRVDSHIKVKDSTSGEDTDGDREGWAGPGGEGGQGLGGEGGWWCCSPDRRTTRRTTGDAGDEHLAEAPLRTGRLGRSGGVAMSQPETTRLTRLPPSGKVEVCKLDSLGAMACASSPGGTLGRPPRGSNGARSCACLAATSFSSASFPLQTTLPGLTTRRFGGAGGRT